MDARCGRARSGLALMALLALGACGEAESDEPSVREVESQTAALERAQGAPAPPAAVQEPAPSPEGTVTAAPAPQPAAPAVSPEPAPAMRRREPSAPRPAASGERREQQPVIEAKVPDPVDPRPEEAFRTMPSTATRADVRSLAPGHTLELSLEDALSTETARPGDAFYATVADDVLGSSNEVLLPRGTRFKGRVVESLESTSSDQPAVLTLALESVTVNGAVRPLTATVVEADVRADARDSNSTTGAKVAAGAAAGAIVGRILGRDRGSAVKGAVVGAVAGTAAAIATRSGHATLREGARIVIRLEQALVIDG